MNTITLTSIICFAAACLLPQQAQPQLNNNGAAIVMGSGAYLVADNLDLQNNGQFLQSAGTVKFSGNNNTAISGTVSPQFYSLDLTKTGASLLLQNNISVNNQVLFNAGLLNLNNFNITLAETAQLTGENEASRITGATGGFVQITINSLNTPATFNPGNLGAVITSGQYFGKTVIRRGHVSQTKGGRWGSSILRYYDITPDWNSFLSARVDFKYFDAELNSLDENVLFMAASPDASTWTSLGADARNVTTNVVSVDLIDNFARLTLSTPLNALPLVWGSINTSCKNNGVTITWKTLQESDTRAFYVRRSSNGRDWQTIATLTAAGNSNTTLTYSYIDPLPVSGALYRITQEDRNGGQTLSPVLQSNCAISDGLSVYPNPVYGQCWINLRSGSSTTAVMRLYDNKGILVKQQLENVAAGASQIAFNMNNLTRGMYSLVVRWGNGNRQTVKIEKL